MGGCGTATGPARSCTDRWRCSSCTWTSSGDCGRSPTSRRRASARRGSRASSRCSARSSSDDYLQTVERPSARARVQARHAGERRARQGQQGPPLHRCTGPPEQRWTERLPFANRPPGYSFTIPPRDDSGFAALEEIRGKGINLVANAVAQSADHIKSFFAMLRLELAFYLGCLNLHARLAREGRADLLPRPRSPMVASRSPRRASTTSASRSTSMTEPSATTSTPTASRS